MSRSLAAGLALLLVACSDSPTSPTEPPVAIATGSQVLRVSLASPCPGFGLGIVYTQVDVSRSGAEWIARASADGNVELRLRQNGASVLAGTMPMAGTIAGTAVHLPALLPGVPISARIDFGSSGNVTLTGIAFAPPFSGATGLSGTGSGAITLSDSAGGSCGGTAFTWGIGPSV